LNVVNDQVMGLGGVVMPGTTHASDDYGPLQDVTRHTVRLDRIRAHWGDMLRVAGSLTLGEAADTT
jgi:TnpA family transposase